MTAVLNIHYDKQTDFRNLLSKNWCSTATPDDDFNKSRVVKLHVRYAAVTVRW